MFLSSFRRPPSSNNRSTPNRNLPATTVSGTSITRPRAGKPVEVKPQVGAIQRPFPTLSTPTLLDQPKPSIKQQP